MTFPSGNMSYVVANGTASTNVFITLLMTREPTTNDVTYSVTQRWVNINTGLEYILIGFTSFSGDKQATWLNITAAGSSNLHSLTGNIGGIVSPTASNINTVGDATSIEVVGNPGTSTLTANVILPAAHTVLASNTTSITGISPSTAGFILTSNGVGADPSFQENSATGFEWSAKTTTFTAVSENGYITDGTFTATLPAAPSLGETVSFIVGSGVLTIQAEASTFIVVGSAASSSGGRAVSESGVTGNTLTLVYVAGTPAAWSTLQAPQGNWTLS